MSNIRDTLQERGSRYGAFEGNAHISQQLKSIWSNSPTGDALRSGRLDDVSAAVISEGLEMILHKIARICNGDPMYDDNWRDIIGYAQLVLDYLNRQQKEKRLSTEDFKKLLASHEAAKAQSGIRATLQDHLCKQEKNDVL